jgi:alpha-beta hydrolase superfamily lysophospholipase
VWVQAILRALDNTPLGEASIDRFTRDVYVYLTNKAVRKAIDSIVSEKIPGEPSVVVGHSLGSLVTYNVLSARGEKAAVHRYITVGSPLGVKAIQRLLVPPALAMPSGVRQWFNAFDNRDVVALRALDASGFPIDPPITNKGDVNNHTENRHGIDGYLDDPDVARWIYEAVTRKAADVAR